MVEVISIKGNVAKRVGKKIIETLSEENPPTLLLLSGGSALEILKYVGLSQCEGLTISMIDERFSKDPKINNFSQLMETGFYKNIKKSGARFIDSRVGEGETSVSFGMRFKNNITTWFKNNPKGNVLAILGIGEDGHIAGIMPYPESPKKFNELFENEKKYIVSYDAGAKSKYPLRATVSNVFLRKTVDFALMYAVGEKKKQAISNVFSKKGNLFETPARIIHEMKDVVVFLPSYLFPSNLEI